MRPRNMSTARAKKYYYHKDPLFSKKNGISKWHGAGSVKLGLPGDVEKTFLNIIAGNDPMGNQIIQDGVNGEHWACADIPFSAPKSVSILTLHVGALPQIRPQKITRSALI